MREILPVAARWAREGRPFALATVVAVRGSAPREVGASMVVGQDGAVFGNVSGGCVDAAVAADGADAMRDGRPRLARYGIDDDPLHGIALMCGGEIDVVVRAIAPGSAAARDLVALAGAGDAGASYVVGTAGAHLGGAWLVGRDGPARPADPAVAALLADAAALAGDGRPRSLAYDAAGCRADDGADAALVIPFGAKPRLVVVGAVEFAVPLTALAAQLGFRPIVVDARPAFASPERFPHAEVVVAQPARHLASAALDRATAVCVLTHDERFDVPSLLEALSSPAGYVGAMGSRRTHEDRLRRLAEAGATPAQLDRLRSPIGLDLGGRRADETALSILAEIVAVRNGATGRPLSQLRGAIHDAAGAAP